NRGHSADFWEYESRIGRNRLITYPLNFLKLFIQLQHFVRSPAGPKRSVI
ncbi:MAG: hypothetical protein ACI9C9_001946, partial [Marivirga sp.]